MFSVSPHLLGILPLSPLAQDHSLNESIRKKSWTVWLWKTAAEEDTMESTMKTETKAGLEVTSTVKSELSSKLVFLASQKISEIDGWKQKTPTKIIAGCCEPWYSMHGGQKTII